MLSNIFLACFGLCFQVVLTFDPYQGFLEQGKPCFETIDSPGCDTTLYESFSPSSPNVLNIVPRTLVYLFTPSSPDAAEQLHLCGGGLPPDSTYDPNADTEIFIHGGTDGVCRTAWQRECKEQLYQRASKTNSSYNAILVDWTWGNAPDAVAGANCRIVGEQIGFVIRNIIEQAGVGPEKFHIIGHSFGAISAGYAGKNVPGIRRITGLDPSWVPFAHTPPSERLAYTDAKIVDVIHSNSYHCVLVGFGDERPQGHADFYPNGGTVQPSCPRYILEAFLRKEYSEAFASLYPQLCSHLQAFEYYKISINPSGCEFVGVASDSYRQFRSRSPGSQCMKWAVMGMDYELYHQDDGQRRKYFLKTKPECPYYDDSYLGGKKFPFRTSCTA